MQPLGHLFRFITLVNAGKFRIVFIFTAYASISYGATKGPIKSGQFSTTPIFLFRASLFVLSRTCILQALLLCQASFYLAYIRRGCSTSTVQIRRDILWLFIKHPHHFSMNFEELRRNFGCTSGDV